MSGSSPEISSSRLGGTAADSPSWFCVRSMPKHEHIAAAHLLRIPTVEVFNPQFRVRRPTARGPVWFLESCFPGYVFAKFELRSHLNAVHFCPGVSSVLKFGLGYPEVPEAVVEELRSFFGPQAVLERPERCQPGDTVRIREGAFRDLTAVVTAVLPAKHRVQALLEFLGRATVVELDLDCVSQEAN
jgi:transcriptional antiterminator RfaH